MYSENLKNKLYALAAPLAASLSLHIWGLEILGSSNPIFRIYVESDTGTGIDECTELSRLLSLSLDVEEDIIHGPYSLEVSSPGLERLFFSSEQLKEYIGRTINLTLLEPMPEWPGRKKFQGILQSIDNTELALIPNDANDAVDSQHILKTDWQNVQKARLVHDFDANKGVKLSAAKARS